MSGTQKKTGAGRKPSAAKGKSSSGGAKRTAPRKPKNPPIHREVGAVICLLLAIFSALGYFDIRAIFVTFLTQLERGLLGYGFWLMPIVLLAASIELFRHFGRPVRLQLTFTLLLPLVAGACVHTVLCTGDYQLKQGIVQTLWDAGIAMRSGGVLSGLLSMGLTWVFSAVGCMILLLIALAACVLGIRRLGPTELVHMLNEWRAARYRAKKQKAQQERKERREKCRYRPEDYVQNQEPREKKLTPGIVLRHGPSARKRSGTEIDIPVAAEEEWAGLKAAAGEPEMPEAETVQEIQTEQLSAPVECQEEIVETTPEELFFSEEKQPLFRTGDRVSPAEVLSGEREAELHHDWVPVGPDPVFQSEEERKIDPDLQQQSVTVELPRKAVRQPGAYYYPPVDLLKQTVGLPGQTVNDEVMGVQELLQDTIRSFGIEAQIVDYERGPSVTRYELELKRGVKLNKVTNLAGDIALSLGVSSVRIAPIPGRSSVVGVEVPNKTSVPVPIREVIDSNAFRQHKSKVAFAVGKDISGKCVVGNIAKLPHMLIAGTTGSGKSVCTNSLIISLLYRATPEEVRLIMVDPKMVELSIYNGIPHLLIPVVTDPKKAAGALQWAVTEMMKRYRLFSERHVRDLESYNRAVRREGEEGEEPLPQIVVVIDELADLMLVAAKEVEESICRVAQMGRAAGMHLIIATQRPSSDVITGLMKANIPSRIAFAVASSLESRIILDTSGAEKLVGKGDMLYYPLGSGKPQRVQGCLIEDEEVSAVTQYIKEHFEADYNDEVISQVEANAQANEKNGKGSKALGTELSEDDQERDELYDDAVEVIVNTGMASVSMLQRRLKLGYSRAARLVDQMEEDGVVGPFQGSKPREVLLSKETWQEEKLKNGRKQDEFAMAQRMSEAADAEAELPWTEEAAALNGSAEEI